MRWVLTNPEYARRFTALVTRQLDPAEFMPPALLLELAGKGALAHVRTRLARKHDPTAPLQA